MHNVNESYFAKSISPIENVMVWTKDSTLSGSLYL